MSNKPTHLDRTEEEILACEISDEALESAAAVVKAQAYSFSFCTSPYTCPWA